MQSNKVESSKIATENMVMYYYQALVESGNSDPAQVIATDVAKTIKLNNEQTKYVLENSKGLSAKSMLKNMDSLLSVMEANNKVDLESIALIKQTISVLMTMIKKDGE